MGDPMFPRPLREGSGWQGAVLPRFLRGVVGNPVSPFPNRPWGRLAPPPAGAWGNPVSPCFHLRPHARGAQRQHATVGGLTPSLTLPRWGREPGSSPQGGGWGTPVSPCPNRSWERLAPPAAGAWGNPVSPCPNRWWERLAPHRQGLGKPGFPVCSHQTVMRMAHNARMKIVLFLGGRSPPTPSRGRARFTSESATPRAFVYSFPLRWPISPRRPGKPIPEQVKPVEGLRPPKPSRGRAMFTSESATPRAFVYSFPLRWPISPRRPRKPIPEQVKPVEGLRPPKPSRGRAVFTSGYWL